jgi:hypothetical protein
MYTNAKDYLIFNVYGCNIFNYLFRTESVIYTQYKNSEDLVKERI